MATDSKAEQHARNPHTTFLRIAVIPWIVHFKSPGHLMDQTMDMLDGKIVKETLQRTKRQPEVREAIGNDLQLWKELGELFEAAVPSLERRSFAAQDPATSNYKPNYEGASGTLIASNSQSLNADIARLNDLTQIARNVLSVGESAQNLCAKAQFDQAVFKLISVCVKVTARGYDGDAGTTDEEKWQKVVNNYKTLLMTCLQFLNNLITQNERRKLMLWVELFDSSTDGVLSQYPSDLTTKPELWPTIDDVTGLSGLPMVVGSVASPETPREAVEPSQGTLAAKVKQHPASSPFLLYIAKIGMEVKSELLERGENAGATEIAAVCKQRWQSMPEEEKAKWNALYAELTAKYRDARMESKAMAGPINPPSNSVSNSQDPSVAAKVTMDQEKNKEDVAALARSINQLQSEVNRLKVSVSNSTRTVFQHEAAFQPGKGDIPKAYLSVGDMDRFMPVTGEMAEPPPATEADFRMTYTATYGADILQRGKDDLMKRLETFPERSTPHVAQVASPASPPMSPRSVVNGNGSSPPHADGAGEEISEEEDSEDEDYVVPGDDGRGLLTDVPLILGPHEIEVLPMIILSGIVSPQLPSMPGHGATPEEINAIKNMHTVRCHLLLAQDNGRNLLRELLIFVAAWDLREDELYFKFMVKIMEAVLTNGLMPFAYHAFREPKDIISPAQAVIMKLLTNIFRARQSTKPLAGPEKNSDPAYPLRVDVHLVSFLFTEFRRHIIPQTCALIFLQGQIRLGHASPEDFPLNLWDMERMYEGVYQYLEFFAILTEHDVWKQMMADWELTSELVTLLKGLDAAIPRAQLHAPARSDRVNIQETRPANLPVPPTSDARSFPQEAASPAPVAVERPYDVSAPTISSTALPPALGPYPQEPTTHYADSAQDEPSDFEWRNLKKLAVLVLSSLVWKQRKVQDQVRAHGGIEAILSCCNYDEHNPYIKEHAIMCLRFLIEGNRDNQAVIRALESTEVVPSEVLDQHGYETFLDAKGQVGLRRKEGPKRTTAAAQSQAQQVQQQLQQRLLQGGAGLLPANLPEWMQQVMKELPGKNGQPGVFDKEKAAALAKLDKTFEGRPRY